jgi:hypothetical protein
MSELEQLATRAALRGAAERYAYACDRRDADLFVAQFTEDGVLVAPRGTFVGHTQLRTVTGMLTERYLKTVHAVISQLPMIRDGEASAETYSIARHLYRASDGQLTCYEMTIRYQDEYRLVQGAWLFSRRELVVDIAHRFPVEEEPRR